MKNFAIAVKAFIVHDDKLLMVRREPKDVQFPKLWEIPGGRLALGEDPYDGLKRETKEETGIDIEVICPFNVHHFTRVDKQIITMIIFLCKPKNTKLNLSEEHVAHEWIHLDKCKEKLGGFFHSDVDAYKKLNLSKLL